MNVTIVLWTLFTVFGIINKRVKQNSTAMVVPSVFGSMSNNSQNKRREIVFFGIEAHHRFSGGCSCAFFFQPVGSLPASYETRSDTLI